MVSPDCVVTSEFGTYTSLQAIGVGHSHGKLAHRVGSSQEGRMPWIGGLDLKHS